MNWWIEFLEEAWWIILLLSISILVFIGAILSLPKKTKKKKNEDYFTI